MKPSVQVILFVSVPTRNEQICVHLEPSGSGTTQSFIGTVFGVAGQQIEIAPDARLAEVVAELAAAASVPPEGRVMGIEALLFDA